VGLVAGLWVEQAYGVSHRPGFGLVGSVPRSLSTQPPFVTQALNNNNGWQKTKTQEPQNLTPGSQS